MRQSDISDVIGGSRGVSYVELPFRKLTRATGSLVVREEIPSTDGDVEVLLGNTGVPYSTTTVKTWILQNALNNPTSTGGGDGTQFAGVYMDDVQMALLVSSPAALKNTPNQAYIIGDAGLVIPSFSDDTTIQANYPAANTPAEITAIRQTLTANRVLVSLAANDRPQLHSFKATYTVAFVEARTQDIELSQIEFFESGNLVFTYTEDKRLGR